MRFPLLLASLALASSACAPAPPPPPAAPPPPLVCPSVAPAPPAAPAAIRNVEDVKDRVMAAMNARDAAGIFALFDDAMAKAVPLDKMTMIVNAFAAQKGAWRSATREAGESSDSEGTWRVETEREGLRLRLALDGDHKIAGLRFMEPAKPEPPVAKSDLPLSLPFRGEWSVFWGGNTVKDNYHVPYRDQCRAADILVFGPDGKSYKGDGKVNADYLVYGKEIVAVADGTVETVVDGTPENVPGAENGYVIPGNYIVIRHSPTLYSYYAHLQPGKIKVKAGAKVKRGAVLGLAGNSGNSTEPHLHFQLMDGPDPNTAWGVEPVFEHVVLTRGGKTETVTGYTFKKGDLIRSP